LLQKAGLFLEQLTESQHRTIKVTKALVQHNRLNLNNITNLITRGIKHLVSTEGNNLDGYSEKLRIFLSTFLKDNFIRLAGSGQQMLQTVKHFVNNKTDTLKHIEQTIPNQLSKIFHLQEARIKTLEKTNQLLDPEVVLKRGFSITTAKGKIVKKATDLEKGDLIKTNYFRGESISKIESTE
jgi:exodeoxyribonuclease VII large subunit